MWQWGAVPCLSALNHHDRLEMGCPKMVAFASQKHKRRSHLHSRLRYFLQTPFLEKIFFPLQQKTIAQIIWNCAYLWDMCVCVFLLNSEDLEPLLDTSVWNRAWRQVEKVIFHHRGLQPHRVSITGCSSINEWVASTFVSLFLVSRVINYLRCMAPLQNAVTAILT